MDESSYLNPSAMQAQCSGAIQILESDKEALYILESSLDGFINDGEIQGASFAAMKQQISDYKTVLQAIIMAHESDKMDYETLKGAVAGEVLDGSKIIPNKKKAKKSQEEYERRAEEYRGMACSCPPAFFWMSGYYMDIAFTCSRLAEIEYRLYEKWKEKEETYDAIEAATSGLFSASSGMRAAIDSALSGIKGAFHVAEGGFTIDRSAPWRKEIGAAKISIIKKQLNLMGIEPERVQELTDMGFTYEGLWGYRLMCQNEQEKEFYIQILSGTEENYIKAFEINPYELNDGMTIFMADYASRILELNDDGTSTEESVRKIMEFNNALLQSEIYCVDGEGNFTDKKYRDVYLQKIATGTEALLMKDVLTLSGMSKNAEEYDIMETLYNQRCSMTLFWTTEANVITNLENMGYGVNQDYNISELFFSQESAPRFHLNHFSSFAGERVSDYIETDFKERGQWDTYFTSARIGELERIKQQAMSRALLNISKDMLMLCYAEVSGLGAGVTEMMLTALQGNVPTIKGVDGYLDVNGKLGLQMGNTIATGILNEYIAYNNADLALKKEEWKTYIEWFGKGGTYTITYDNVSIMPTKNIAFVGCYNPDTMRAMEYWKENGMADWCNLAADDDIKENLEMNHPGFDMTICDRIVHGENNATVQNKGDEITIGQFENVIISIESGIENGGTVRDRFEKLVEREGRVR